MADITSFPSQVIAGTNVTIQGTEFEATEGVLFLGGVSQTIVSWSDTTIVFTANLGANLYGVVTTLSVIPQSEVSVITPVFSNGELGVFFDPSDEATLFKDTAGTVPVTADGDLVALMRDKSGNNNHATQSDSSSRPAFRTNGTLSWLESSGTQGFEFPSVSLASDAVDSMSAVMVTGGAGAYRAIWSGRGSSTAGDIIYATNGNDWEYWSGDGANFNSKLGTRTVNLNEAVTIHTSRSSNGNKSIDADGTVVSDTGVTVGTTSGPNRLLVGGNTTEAQSFGMSGLFYAFIMLNRNLTPAEIVEVKQYMAEKSGAT
jgi:hypothetical protein